MFFLLFLLFHFRNNFYQALKAPHNCAPGSSKNCVSTAPIVGIHIDNAPPSSSSLILNNGKTNGFPGGEIMDGSLNYNQSFNVSSFRSQSLGQISQPPIIQARFQPQYHLQQNSTPSPFSHLSQQRPCSSRIQDLHQQHSFYQQIHRNHLNLRCGNLISATDGEIDSEQEKIILAVAAAGVGNNSGSGEELMNIDETNSNSNNEVSNNYSLLVSNVPTHLVSSSTTVSITTPAIGLGQCIKDPSSKCGSNDLQNTVPT